MGRGVRSEIASEEKSAADFVESWREAERGEMSRAPMERLYFQELETLLQVLTPRRLEALKVLHEAGSLSVRALAKRLNRDYKNVHRDAQTLQRVGLIEKTEDGRLSAPWERIVAEVRLAA